jgi:hypothetical protein
MAINRGARASSYPTLSHFMATPSPPHTRPLPLHLPHKHTLAQESFGRSSIVRPPVLSLFVCSSDRSLFVRLFVRSFVRSFVQIIFFLPLRYRNSDRSFVRSFDHSSFVHSSYSSFVHRHYSSFIVRSYELFTITSHRYYSPLLFTVTIHHRYYSSMIPIITFSSSLFIVTIHRSSDHPKFQLLIRHTVQST